jgi:fatty acid amide hydrolase 2
MIRALDPLLTISGSAMARMIRKREVRSVDLVQIHLRRIREVNPRLNAMVADRFDQALAEARDADLRVARDDPATLPPFLGVPCTVKECFALTGMPNTGGLPSRVGHPATSDATTVARLRAAGAIPMGVTNVSELCLWMEASNPNYGRTNCAYDQRRTSGGSSGGEGALIGSAASPFGVGSDIGGSIRMPAFFNGVFGHKPTGGLVPNTGQFPCAMHGLVRVLATGPICRRAEDLYPLLRIMAGPDGQDSGCAAMPIEDPSTVSLEGLDVVSVEGDGLLSVSRDLLQAQQRAAKALAARGARVRVERVPAMARAILMWTATVATGGETAYLDLMADGKPFNLGAEFLRWAVGRGRHTLPALGLGLIEAASTRFPPRFEPLLQETKALAEDLASRLGPGGVLLYPSHVEVAPLHHKSLLRPINWIYTGIFNALKMPVTQVPLGLDARGLPLGCQVASIPGNDHRTIAVALALEAALGGWSPPGAGASG